MSLGGPGDENDAVSTAVDNATAAGVLSVIAAGNSGAYFTIGSPGTARTALTVGATDDVDQLAYFSSRGPTTVERLVKPEITAPGVEICAASIANGFPGTECLGTTFFSISGTSMATPHVSGAAALLLGLRPSLTPAEAKAILQQASLPVGLDVTSGGAGRLDARAAIDVTTIVTPAPVNLGIDDGSDAIWERSAEVSVRNLGTAPRTYTLTVPADAFPAGVSTSITPATLTVGAGAVATATLTVTVDNAIVPSSSSPPFVHSGMLVATSDSESTEILVSFAKKTATGGKKHQLSGRAVLMRDRDGVPAARTLSTQSTDKTIVPPAPGSASDPTTSGAVLNVINPITGELATFELPASGWEGIGEPAGSNGYRYSDRDEQHGPCRQVDLKAGSLKASCKGAQIAFSLDEPAQGEIGLELRSGHTAYCMDFGGTIRKDVPAVDGGKGMFKAQLAPTPAACPFVPSDSCLGNCGGYAGYCWCDAACVGYGDCCQDYNELCME
jgi:hypothetical protein